jgi:hypothetical protein
MVVLVVREPETKFGNPYEVMRITPENASREYHARYPKCPMSKEGVVLRKGYWGRIVIIVLRSESDLRGEGDNVTTGVLTGILY